MLDYDLARLYHVETKALNQAVKRNIKRFPPDFMFQLSAEEVLNMRSQIVTASRRNTSTPPFAFTEQGIAMLSGVLKSDIAIAANIAIMRAFVQVREYLMTAINDLSEDVRRDIDSLCIAISKLAAKIEEKKNEPRRKIGFKQAAGEES